ncbi:hypothetical protein [Mucilaginibacter gotjawali]|uniref:Uncharacterized protein n=2 Tax=Mucilaginibacter gotjawali TaxID=1550579 RepID=A0A839SQI2_9SPHI|nr:hypothetical protein [Mucilaginibacter gotjawali]MBB3058617.1 hypothetical protein [Mucilaginibacter gotjawali]BAU52416.1 hypothetical protein MgSA37_00577 [Mucilaginibacter gotjawali]
MIKIPCLICIMWLLLLNCRPCFAQTVAPSTGNTYGKKESGDSTISRDKEANPSKIKVLKIPVVLNLNRSAGIVTVDFTVTKNGDIIETHINTKHTTVTDTSLIRKCEAAVKNTKLVITGPAPATQKSHLTFTFEVK